MSPVRPRYPAQRYRLGIRESRSARNTFAQGPAQGLYFFRLPPLSGARQVIGQEVGIEARSRGIGVSEHPCQEEKIWLLSPTRRPSARTRSSAVTSRRSPRKKRTSRWIYCRSYVAALGRRTLPGPRRSGARGRPRKRARAREVVRRALIADGLGECTAIDAQDFDDHGRSVTSLPARWERSVAGRSCLESRDHVPQSAQCPSVLGAPTAHEKNGPISNERAANSSCRLPHRFIAFGLLASR